jgi:hypothetical protein
VFVDDCGFPDKSDEYDTLLHTIDGGTVLRKLKHDPPVIDAVDPAFNVQFDKILHGPILATLNLSHLDVHALNRITDLIKRYWSVFDEGTVFVPV